MNHSANPQPPENETESERARLRILDPRARYDAAPNNSFGMVPADVFGRVEPGAVCVYAALTQFSDINGWCNPSIDTLVSLIKTISKPTAMKHVQALADAGLIIITEKRRGSQRRFEYTLPYHPPVKKLYRSDIDSSDGRSKEFTGTGQESSPANIPPVKFSTSTGKVFDSSPVKNFDRNNTNEQYQSHIQDAAPAADENPPKKKPRTPTQGTRIDPGLTLSEEWRADAIDMGFPAGRVQWLFDEFKDYWVSATGKSATKGDWLATWRNRVRYKMDQMGLEPKPLANRKTTAEPKTVDRPYDPVLYSLARERQRKVTNKLGVELPAVLEMYDRDIADIDLQLHNLGITPEEAERWLQSQ
jgi:hypothetical protein